ncbi:MAG: thioredoxin family protein [Phenylobacterium sp.]|nr:thioredoxin family protein [Phenylobacterium sp.]
MNRRRLLLTAAAATAAPPALAAGSAPRLSIKTFAELKTPLPLPYDEAADADAVVDRARTQARRQGKRLLIDLGGNWCPDCRILAATMALPELDRFMKAHFVTVMVDVGRFDRNLQIPARYGVTSRLPGVPALMVIDPKSDRLLNPGNFSALSNARGMSPQALADWIAGWAA